MVSLLFTLSINTKKKNNDNLPNSLVEREDYI